MRSIQPIGVPYDLQRRDVRMGLSPAQVLPRLITLGVSIEPAVVLDVPGLADDDQAGVGAIQAALAHEVRQAHERGLLPLVVGGDCTTALGVAAGLAAVSPSVVWIDAHGDFNTPATSPSGYLGGMPLATLTGRGLPELRRVVGLAEPVAEAHVALLGVRDLDPPEAAALAASAVQMLTTDEVRSHPAALDAALSVAVGDRPFYLHLDVDVLDPAVMPGVVYPVPNGLTEADLVALIRQVRRHGILAAATLTAINLDAQHRERVLDTALRIIQAALEEPQ